MTKKSPSNIPEENKTQFLNDFCNCLNEIGKKRNINKEGRVFEYFLQYYLEKLGFQNVILTPSGNDNGIDLIADFPLNIPIDDIDLIDRYYISAKQFKPKEEVDPEPTHKANSNPRQMQPTHIRDLRGAIENGKGIFITTGKVSDKAKYNALYSDYLRDKDTALQRNIPVYVIDYDPLIKSFCSLNLEFVKKSKDRIQLDRKKLKEIVMGLIRGYEYDEKTNEIIRMPAIIKEGYVKHNNLPVPSPFKKYIQIDIENEKRRMFINIRFNDEQMMKKRYVNEENGCVSKNMSYLYKKYLDKVKKEKTELEAIWEKDPENNNGVHVIIQEKENKQKK